MFSVNAVYLHIYLYSHSLFLFCVIAPLMILVFHLLSSVPHHRASSDEVGELFGIASERLPQAAEPPRVRRCHHPSGPCVRQGG